MRQAYRKKYDVRTRKACFTLLTFLVFTEWLICSLIRALIDICTATRAENLTGAIESRRINERWCVFIRGRGKI
jgi:hypothetical protein